MRPKDVDFSSPYVMDDFLPPEEFETIRSLVCNETKDFSFRFFPHKYVSSPSELEDQSLRNDYWNWYGIHLLYNFDVPNSPYFESIYQLFIPRFKDLGMCESLIRIKANFFPYTETLKEHHPHQDYPFFNTGAIYSLNTCDGFTRMADGSKVDSVANRIVFFDASSSHNSTTTSDCAARYNINFNFK